MILDLAASGGSSPAEIPWTALVAIAASLLSAGLVIRNWFYGGSVISVEFRILQRRWLGADITATIPRWRETMDLSGPSMSGHRLDIVKLTVRNKGRTAATILEPGLRVGPPPAARSTTTFGATRLLDDGETDKTIRIEAHDAKEFYFCLAPIIRSARADMGDVPLAMRGSIETGTGAKRLSRRRYRWAWNVLVLPPGVDWVGSDPLTLADRLWLWSELTSAIFEPPITSTHQLIGAAATLAEDGASKDELVAELKKLAAIFPSNPNFQAKGGWLDGLASHALVLLSRAE